MTLSGEGDSMIPRRRFIGGSATLAGALGTLATADVEVDAASPQRVDPDLRPVVDALDRLRDELRQQRGFAEILPVRDAQRVFLRANGKLPDFIEVGADVWLAIHDWHVRWQQPLQLGRDVSGRHTVLLLQTVVILRPDVPVTFMGLPYDASR